MLLRWIIGVLLVAMMPAQAEPTAREIIDRVVAQDGLLHRHRGAFDFDLEITREKLDDQRHVLSTSREKVVVEGARRPDFGTHVDTGNAPESEAKKASRDEPFELLNIIDHYDYALEGEEMADGILCYKIAFTPKPDMPYRNREEKVLNAVSGHIWASVKDCSLIRDEGALMHPVAVAWFFASLREMEFCFDTAPLPNGEYGPRREQYRYLVYIPFLTIHERDTRQMSNYRAAGVPAAGR
jgi:hypothetical protein